jgi:lipopolysaccharide biosynthesis glycosyltransferase
MDPWDASFHALIPLLSDRRVQELDLAHGLMLAKSSLTRRGPPSAAFADSVADYQLLQGWNGWSYSFEPVGSIPSTDTSFLAVVAHDQWSTEKSRFSPYITDTSQTTLVTAKGVGLAPVRTYRSPRAMDVSLHLTYSSAHQCGDGTHLRLFYRPSPGEFPEELFSRNTMRRSSDSFKEDLSLVVGSTIYLVTEPLASDNCDLVDVRLTLTPTVKGNQAWSKVAKAQSRKAAASAPIEPAKSSDEQWVAVLPPPEAPTFHIALIFDKNRFDFAKQVVRSADHFIASRALHFHIVAPIPLHAEIYEFFRDIPAVVQLYDHSLCYYFARQVLAFSNPDIHISAHCKIFLSEIITMTTRVLYLDTDVTIFGDISTCYGESDLPSTLFTMGIDMGDSCQQSPDDCWPIGLHWRVPEGLTCGNIEVKDPRTLTPRSCAAAGELETVQVNGGVAMMELTRMRDTGFVARYVQSIVHHYRIVGKTAVWGEQDFLNSYFRLFPAHVELLPCGCNYQWSGSRKEVKCGEQPTFIGHAW